MPSRSRSPGSARSRRSGFSRSSPAGPKLRLRADGRPYETDQGNWIFDCAIGPITDPVALAARLAARAGIVEHGLFCGLASEVFVAGESGVRELRRSG